MNQYEQDLKTQQENKKKTDDTITKGLLLGGAILGGIALYNAHINNNIPKTTLNSLFDNKLSPNTVENGNNTIVPPITEPNLETTAIPEQPAAFPYQYNGEVPENMLKYQDNLGASLKYALQDENTRNSNFGLYWKTLPEQFKNDNITYLNERGFTLPGKEMPLYTKNGSLLANKYDRVVTGQYGSFIEIDPKDFIGKTIVAPGQEFRLTPEFRGKYQWYIPTDNSGAKLYKQINGVKYADYKPNKWYISPFEVTTGEIPAVTTPDLGTQQMNNIVGINIASNSPDELGRLLTNPGNDMPIFYKGRLFRNSEHAYQSYKSGQFDEIAYNSTAMKPKGSLPVNKELSAGIMEDIITNKLIQHPELIQQIDARGGLDFIKASTHKVGNISDYWTNGGFINALGNAYTKAKGMPTPGKIIPYDGEYSIEFARQHPNDLIVFGDNTRSRLYTHDNVSRTQAVIRNEPNAIGLDTKRDMFENPDSYFTDDVVNNPEFKKYLYETTDTLLNALQSGKNVIVHKRIGLGKAQLDKRAPKLLALYRNLLNNLYKIFH